MLEIALGLCKRAAIDSWESFATVFASCSLIYIVEELNMRCSPRIHCLT